METVSLYVRIPVELRERLDHGCMRRHNGYVRKGDLAHLVVDALRAGLDEMFPAAAPAPAPALAKAKAKGKAKVKARRRS